MSTFAKNLNQLLSGIPATLVGGVFLVLSFVLPRVGVALPVDPAWATVIISGIPLLYLSVWRIIHNPGISKISSALLITIAMLAAIAIGDLFAAGEVAFIMAIGAILEEMTTNRAKKGLKKLFSLSPTQARRLKDGEEKPVPAEEVRAGDILRVLPGEMIPADGVILTGETSVDQSVMTGESLPVDKAAGDEVFCGTLNCFGSVDIRVTKAGADSSLQKLIRLVQEAEENKAPMTRIADRAASWLVPVALLIAVIAGLATKDIVRAVTVLVVFCPCALVLATPTAIMAAIGQAAKHGVIIKSGEALENMGRADTIALDKTGTLTCGHLEVSDVLAYGGQGEREVLAMAASAELRSEHPLGKAVAAFAKGQGVGTADPEGFRMESGRGVSARLDGKQVLCGNEAFLLENGVEISLEVSTDLERLRAQGKASILVAAGGGCAGIVALSDTLRPEAGEVARQLMDMGAQPLLLTGDNERAASYFAAQAGIRQVYAGLLPEGKAGRITALRQEGRRVCMVGDGVNDAPSLKTADVGVAMGGIGSDIAVEAADIALMGDDISKLPYLKRLANATVRTIKISITLSMCINFVAVALSVLGLLNPTTGALVHNAGSCFVVLFAALLYDRKFL